MRKGLGWALAFGAAIALCVLSVSVHAQTTPQRTPIPMAVMTREPALSQVQLSPDGAHIAAITSLDGETRAISIWATDAVDHAPVRFGISGGAERNNVRFASIAWVSNDRILVLMTQPVVFGSGPEARYYTALARIVNLDGSQWIEPLAPGGVRTQLEQYADKFLSIQLLDQLPGDDRHILVSHQTLDGTSVERVDVNTGEGERIAQLGDTQSIVPITDANGEIRVRANVTPRAGVFTISYDIRDPHTNAWRDQPALTYPARTRRDMQVLGFDPENQDELIVRDNEGQNFSYLRGYSISRSQFVETIFQDAHHDISGVLYDHDDQGRPTKIIGFTYLDDMEKPYYNDPTYRSLYDGLRAQLPGRAIVIGPHHGHDRIIVASNSQYPPAFYLLSDDNHLHPLGVSTPGVASDQLAPTQLVRYPARDGMSIPAFLTLPYGWHPGDAPLPVIIQPHGGPWSRNDDDWGGGDIPVTQYFASRGFAVMQPQFRGSTGWGDALWRAGDGQWGLSMQDDNDDALAYLVQQHIGDPQRALIYGFSYGGFAAMAATVRPNSPYRCAISGAGVSSLQRISNLWSDDPVQRVIQGVTVAGFDPLAHAAGANIPILIYVGDRDQTAPIWHSQHFADALQSAGKPHQFEVIPDMPHGAMTPAMRTQELTLVENYIKGPCGIPY